MVATIEEVTNVIDGNTFETGSRNNAVRLAGVDTPGKGEKGYAEARNALQALIEGKEVTIEMVATGAYGRSIANVKHRGYLVNEVMKKHGK